MLLRKIVAFMNYVVPRMFYSEKHVCIFIICASDSSLAKSKGKVTVNNTNEILLVYDRWALANQSSTKRKQADASVGA